jgi:hypothetical protein
MNRHPENHTKTRENQKKTRTYHLDRNQATNKEKKVFTRNKNGYHKRRIQTEKQADVHKRLKRSKRKIWNL